MKGLNAREFARYVSLNLFGMVGLSLYILADTFFVARGIGSDGLAALNIALPVFSLISGTGLMIGIGGATRYAILRGRGKKYAANAAFTEALFASVFFGFLFAAIGIFGSEELAIQMGADARLRPLATPYIRTLLLFAPAFLGNNLLLAFIRNDNAPKLAMSAMLAGSALNILLDYWFIFPLGWGMFGAALATGLAPVFGVMILAIHFLKKRNHFHLVAIGLKWKSMRKSLLLGMPSFITEFSSGIVMLLFNWSVLKLAGNIGVAAYGVIANIALIAVAAFTGIGQGIQPLLSRAHGEGESGTIRAILRGGLGLAFLLGTGLFLFLFAFAEAVLSIFNAEANSDLQSIALKGMPLYFAAFFFMGLNIVAISYFASVGRSSPSLALSFLRGPGSIVPLLLLLPGLWGLTGVWLVIPVVEALTFILVLFFLLRQHTRKESHATH